MSGGGSFAILLAPDWRDAILTFYAARFPAPMRFIAAPYFETVEARSRFASRTTE
jgi:hypothetical protein